jgi:hypothetical protein
MNSPEDLPAPDTPTAAPRAPVLVPPLAACAEVEYGCVDWYPYRYLPEPGDPPTEPLTASPARAAVRSG